MKGLIPILIFGFIQSRLAAPPQTTPQNQPTTPKSSIIKQINKLNDDGSYTFGYEADDGSFKVETRSKNGAVKGKYGFIDPSGELKTVEYSAGRKLPLLELGTSATETESRTVKPKSSENSGSSDDRSSSSENTSGGASGETSAEEDPAFNSFNAQLGQKDGGEVSELTKRQGQLGGPGGAGGAIGSQYAGQGQRFQGSQPYNPTTQLHGGQFVDGRSQGGFGGAQPQYFQGPGGQPQPQYFSGGPQQFSVGGFGRGGGPQTHYVGRQFPAQYVGTSQFNGGSPGGQGQYVPQGQIQSQDEEGFVSVVPGNFYNGGPQSQSPQFAYNGQSPQVGFARPGFQQGPYQGVGGQQFGGPQFNRFGTAGVGAGRPQTFARGNSQQEYIPNPELDGFSEDNDQDGFVDSYPGNAGNKQEAADEKTPSVKTPAGDRIPGQYAPQVLGPQQTLQGQLRPGVGPGVSPYNEQELQQIYTQQGIGPGGNQSPYPQQFNRFAFQGQPQYQSIPVQQQYSPQIQFGGPQIRGGPFAPGQLGAGGPFQGSPAYSQYPIQGQGQFLPASQGLSGVAGQPQVFSQARGQPQFGNIQGGGGPPGAQFPYDYVGGVGPNGFPIGGPQAQFAQQQQQQLAQGQGPSPGPSAHLPQAPGSVQVTPSDSKKDSN